MAKFGIRRVFAFPFLHNGTDMSSSMVDTSESKDDKSSKDGGRSSSKLRAGEFRTVLHGVNLADLPELLRGRLARYDTNGNGVIDPDELPIPDDDSSISLKTTLNISSNFPPWKQQSKT